MRAAEEQLRLATEAAEVGLWDVDLLTDTLFWPPRVKAMFGISADVPVSMADFYAGLHPDDRDRTSDAFAAALDPARQALYDVEYRTVGKEDGLLRWVAAKGRGIFEGQRCVRVIGTAIDITPRKRVEEQLREEKRVQDLLSTISHALIAAQLDLGLVAKIAVDAGTELSGAALGTFLYNVYDEAGGHETHFARSGMPAESVPSLSRTDHAAVLNWSGSNLGVQRSPDLTDDRRTDADATVRALLEEQLRVRSYLSVPVRTASGAVRGLLCFGHPLPNVFDDRAERLTCTVAALAAVALDNAQLHRASQLELNERKRMEEALSEADRRKDEFLAMLAHELRNPLSPITTAAELLSRTVAHDGPARAAIDVIKRQTRQLTRLVDDLLDVSRITQGLIQLERRPIDMANVIGQAVEAVESQLCSKQHHLTTRTTGHDPLYVDGDQVRLVQCVVNVLTNAIKYTDAGGQIRIETRAEGPQAVIEIADTGSGISAELLPRVFDLFVQSERTLDRSQGGLGIGLAVVKRLIEMHKGTVSVNSAGLGLGSTFQIRLPRVARPQPAFSDTMSAGAIPRRILVVDDNQDAANSLSALLKLHGHETQVAFSGPEALRCVQTFHPEIALLDLGLPDMDGYELARQLRGLPTLRGIRLIALTGYGQAEDRKRTQAAGFDTHLVKPVDLMTLERGMANAASRYVPPV